MWFKRECATIVYLVPVINLLNGYPIQELKQRKGIDQVLPVVSSAGILAMIRSEVPALVICVEGPQNRLLRGEAMVDSRLDLRAW